MARHKKLRRASESYAVWFLEENGYSVLDINRPLRINDIEISDIDIVAEKDGVVYAVEVKAGLADVNTIRQAKVNADLAGYKPMVIARGIDEKARIISDKLGVEVIVLPDILYAGFDDLKHAVKEAIYDFIEEFVEHVDCKNATSQIDILMKLAGSSNFKDFAEKLGLSLEESARVLYKLKEQGLIPKATFRKARFYAKILTVLCGSLRQYKER